MEMEFINKLSTDIYNNEIELFKEDFSKLSDINNIYKIRKFYTDVFIKLLSKDNIQKYIDVLIQYDFDFTKQSYKGIPFIYDFIRYYQNDIFTLLFNKYYNDDKEFLNKYNYKIDIIDEICIHSNINLLNFILSINYKPNLSNLSKSYIHSHIINNYYMKNSINKYKNCYQTFNEILFILSDRFSIDGYIKDSQEFYQIIKNYINNDNVDMLIIYNKMGIDKQFIRNIYDSICQEEKKWDYFSKSLTDWLID